MNDPKHEKPLKTPFVIDESAKAISKAEAEARAAKTATLRQARLQRDIDNPPQPPSKSRKR